MTKKKKHKRKQNEKNIVGEAPLKRHKTSTKVPVEDSEAEEQLDGHMLDSTTLVLIDRKSGKIYSSTERLDNGDRKQIGTVSPQGTLSLFQGKRNA